MPTVFEIELLALVQEYEDAQKQSKYDDCSDVISEVRVKQLQTRCLAAIERAAGRRSVYYEQAIEIPKGVGHAHDFLAGQIGVVQSLLHAIQAGHFQPIGNSVPQVLAPTLGQKSIQKTNSRNVFVVHGRNLNARDAMFAFLQSIGLDPIEWSEAVKMTGTGSPYIGEILQNAFAQAQAVVVLFTGDDFAKLDERLLDKGEPAEVPQPQARANVLFEAGMAFGLHPKRTVLVELGRLRAFSDIGGRHMIRMDDSAAKRLELAERLRTAGCAVQTEGREHWLKAGDFNSAALLQIKFASQLVKPVDDGRIDEIKEKILVFLATQRDDVFAEDLASAISINNQIAAFHLTELKKESKVYDILNTRTPTRWKLHHEGRRYLIKHNLIS